ncbi:MAG: FtsX-like permease family protein [Bacilli bacterium]|nr:FtsX-like permease family protein [Bacilli bacterium]
MIKRSILAVTRRKTKTIIFLVFLFVVASLVLCSISIKNATNKSMENVKKSLSSEVTLSQDMSKLREQFEKNRPEGGPENFSFEDRKSNLSDMHDKMNENSAKKSDVDKISSINYVTDVKYTVTVSGEEDGFTLYENISSSEETNSDRPNMPSMGKMNNNGLDIEGINTFKLQDGYSTGNIELSDGKAFEEEDDDKVIISYELATTNDLSVGDKIKVKDSDGESHELEIIGIYQYKTASDPRTNYNKIYININTATKFMTDTEYNDGNYSVQGVTFYLDNPDNSDKFIKEANKKVTDLEDRNLVLDIDTETYERMVSSLEGVNKFSSIVLGVVIIASIVVISLMVINSIKDRNYEIGVLLSFGEKKSKIIGQFIIELVIIATAGFILSIGTAKIASQKLADVIIKNQETQSETNEKFSRGDRGFGMMPGGSPMGNSKNKDVKVVDEVNVDTSVKDIIILFGLGYIIIISSMVIPSIKILNTDPKSILTGKE